MSTIKTTGTANWTSHCGGNFGFVDTFLREKAYLGYLRRGTEREINEQVVAAYEHIQGVSEQEANDLLTANQDSVKSYNQSVLDREHINTADGIPYYVESQLQTEPSALSPTDQYLVEEQRQFYLSELYDAVRKDGLDSYLSADTMEILNSDNFSYQTYNEAMMQQEAYDAMQAEQRRPVPKTDLSYHRDYSHGFEEDEKGDLVDDGFGFEEFD